VNNVELLSADAYTPELCLHDILDLAKETKIERLVAVMQMADGTVQTIISSMHISTIAYLAKCLDRRVYNLIEGSAER
jgi:DNA-binding NtrC family response regulator